MTDSTRTDASEIEHETEHETELELEPQPDAQEPEPELDEQWADEVVEQEFLVVAAPGLDTELPWEHHDEPRALEPVDDITLVVATVGEGEALDAPVTAVLPAPDAEAPFWRNAVTRSLAVVGGIRERVPAFPRPRTSTALLDAPRELATLEANNISAWFGDHNVLDRVSLTMPAGVITSLIGPSGCGKSTFLRIMNRMHELVPSASLAGEVLLDGDDIYRADRPLTDARKSIGMVFQKPNPFPAMSIYDNVVAGLRLTGLSVDRDRKDELVETSLRRAGLWNEVKDRLRAPGGGLSGGQQQRLCIARSLAVMPRVLLMDEPCSALDPTSTRVIEETMLSLVDDVTIVIVTHNMQQAQRVSTQCAFFLASQGKPGAIVEYGDTEAMFAEPIDARTFDYVNGRFG